MTAPARTAALRALSVIAGGHRDLPSALADSRSRLEDERDRSLTAAIVHGALRWQRACDFLVEHFAHRPVDTVDPDVLLILRLSLFQILHLDRVPSAAVVDDAVNLTRASGKKSATGFVNAVLRSVLRQRNRLPWPARPATAADRDAALRYLGVTWSHPDWLVSRWLDRYGLDDTERWVRFNNDAAPLTLSVNRLRTSRHELQAALAAEAIETEETPLAPHGLRVVRGNPVRRGALGNYFVQDEASQLVPLVVDARPGERVLDLCASPGGKTVLMIGDMQDQGVLVACDVRPRRMALLQDTVASSGSRHVHLVQVDRDDHLPFAPAFDRVLVDAPCSGLGTVRRDPDIKWRRSEGELPGLADRQVALLGRAAGVVRPGGRLVYATCSSEPEENEGVVDRFLAAHPACSLIDLRSSGSAIPSSVLDRRGMLRTLPFAHGLEAFFAASIRYNESV